MLGCLTVCGNELVVWLPEPDAGTQVCLGFDGSEVDDWTALRAETIDGYQFTPRYGPDRKPTIWNPAEHYDHRTPRPEVHAALEDVFERYDVFRAYFDPPLWRRRSTSGNSGTGHQGHPVDDVSAASDALGS